MSKTLIQIVKLFARDDDDSEDSTEECPLGNDWNGKNNLRILAVFMVLISSSIGVYFPILSSSYSFIKLPNWCWFIAKFFGSGVIVATGFIHLLEPASDDLSQDCLGGTFADYPWAFGICLMSLFVVFLTEIIAQYYVEKATGFKNSNVHSHFGNKDDDHSAEDEVDLKAGEDEEITKSSKDSQSHMIGSNHFSHDQDHEDPEALATPGVANAFDRESYLNQILSVFILEFGVLFHSVFVGLSLGVAGDEFTTLFIVIVFHQMFEGLGLGTRIAEVSWQKDRRYTPWVLAAAYAVITPIAIAIGIGVRHSFSPDGRTSLIANGCFDAISAGILLYTGIVELMAHEFLYSNHFKGPDGLKKSLLAFIVMCFGAGLMALLGKWA